MANPICHWDLMVDDLERSKASYQRTLRQVVEAGGRVLMPKTEIPGVGWVAMFADPDGIPIGLLEPRSA